MSSHPHPRHTISGGWFVAALGLIIGVLWGFRVFEERQRRALVQPVISEIHAANLTGLRDEAGRTDDWIELWNPTEHPIDLEGWALTDDFRELHKWRFPAVRLDPGRFVVVFGSGRHLTNAGATLHTNFKLDPAGEYLALVAPGASRPAQEFLPKFPRQIDDVSFGLLPEVFGRAGEFGGIATGDLGFLLTPTPGARNQDELLGVVTDTRFSVNRGLRERPAQLTLATRTPNAIIRYTFDGSAPNPTNGLVYSSPIEVNRTAVVRAAAFRAGFKPSNVDTHTYLFPGDLREQDGRGLPPTWGLRNGARVPADYEMDPDIVGAGANRERIRQGLQALPVVSLVVAPGDLYDPNTGIYANPMESGEAWERPGSIEWIPMEGKGAVQVTGGVRIQGGWSRRPEESPKHSFRLRFRSSLGAPAFEQPLFDRPGPEEHRELILRAGNNNSWLHWSAAERQRGELLRDQWMRDTLLDLGQPAARGTIAQLFLNGLYWGVYNLVERPDAEFLAQRFGGVADDYDARNGDNVISGDTVAWDQMFALANAGLAGDDAYAEVSRLLDVPAFIDFMLVHLYGGAADLDRASNWYAGRPRRVNGRYVFLMWDAERSLEEVGANAFGLDDDQSPARLFQKLRENITFRNALLERARQLTAAGGPLSPEACAARYRRLADQVRPAMILESARWGDYRRDVHPYREGPYEIYTVEEHWEPEVKRLLDEYFPKRTAVFMKQVESAMVGTTGR